MSVAELRALADGDTKPRSNVRAERELLTSILQSPALLTDAEPHVGAADFFDPRNAMVFAAMLALRERGQQVEPVALERELGDRVPPSYVAELLAAQLPAHHAEQHARMIADDAVARRLDEACTEIGSRARNPRFAINELVDFANERVMSASTRKANTDPTRICDVVQEVFQRLEAGPGSTDGGLMTGLADVDKTSGGFSSGQLVILGARPRVGKTALAMQFARQIAENVNVLVFSLEMNKRELVERMLSNESRVSHTGIRRFQIGHEAFAELTAGAQRIHSLPIDIDDTPSLPISDIRSRARRYARRHKLGMIVIDYLQLIVGPRSESREQSVAAVSRGLKALAKELEVPILALAQLNRAGRDKPTMETLRESGGIEADADVVMLLHRDELVNRKTEHRGIADLIFAKQRSAASEVAIKLKFTGSCVRFDNIQHEYEPNHQDVDEDQ